MFVCLCVCVWLRERHTSNLIDVNRKSPGMVRNDAPVNRNEKHCFISNLFSKAFIQSDLQYTHKCVMGGGRVLAQGISTWSTIRPWDSNPLLATSPHVKVFKQNKKVTQYNTLLCFQPHTNCINSCIQMINMKSRKTMKNQVMSLCFTYV